jgi:hypothetical protein
MEKDDLSRVKSAVYNQINSVILDPVRRRSRSGSTLRCGDGVQRTGIPGILIQSMDFQEIAAWLAMRSAQANFPCPKCLVPKESLAQLTKRFVHRTIETMRATLLKARGQDTKTDRETILRSKGLHNIEVCQLRLSTCV